MRRAVPWAAVLLVLALGAATFLRLTGPRLAFTNRLVAPVRLAVPGAAPRSVAAGETVTLPVARGRTLVAEWSLVRPLSADGRAMGEEVRGVILARGPRGVVRAAAASRTPSGDYFAPLITNATARPLRVTVNWGLAGALDCGCAVRPAARRVFIGYYRLYQNSTARAREPNGASATFRDLGPEALARGGVVGLRYEERDFARR